MITYLVMMLFAKSFAQSEGNLPIPFHQPLNVADYPVRDKVPPPNAGFLKMYDITKLSTAAKQRTPANQPSAPTCDATANLGGNGSCDWSCTHCTRPKDIVTCKSNKNWGLTYDDGPTEHTIPILDALKKHNLKATFCVVGSRVLERPDVLLRTYLEGHQICIHTWSHHALTTISSDSIVSEFEYTLKIVEQVIGQRPLTWRPPFGDVDDRVRAIATILGLQNPIMWNRDTGDWQLNSNPNALPSGTITNMFADWINSANKSTIGSVSLEHDLTAASSQAALPPIELLYQSKIQAMTVAECTGDMRPYRNQAVVLPTSGAILSNSTNATLPPNVTIPVGVVPVNSTPITGGSAQPVPFEPEEPVPVPTILPNDVKNGARQLQVTVGMVVYAVFCLSL